LSDSLRLPALNEHEAQALCYPTAGLKWTPEMSKWSEKLLEVVKLLDPERARDYKNCLGARQILTHMSSSGFFNPRGWKYIPPYIFNQLLG
jgi:hypothetical protein